MNSAFVFTPEMAYVMSGKKGTSHIGYRDFVEIAKDAFCVVRSVICYYRFIKIHNLKYLFSMHIRQCCALGVTLPSNGVRRDARMFESFGY